ncbi:MAG: 2-oxoacid:acceptor oxidoreductase family protein [Clostridia bacterium]|nr:2-oxoacid:acceptor oxidoreductase family protein [Clostridia bacterium]
MQPGSVMVIDEELEDFAGRVVEQGRVLTIPVSRLLREELSPRVGNILFLGAVVKLLDMVNLENVKRALRRHFQYKFAASPELEELNFKALEMGMRLAH